MTDTPQRTRHYCVFAFFNGQIDWEERRPPAGDYLIWECSSENEALAVQIALSVAFQDDITWRNDSYERPGPLHSGLRIQRDRAARKHELLREILESARSASQEHRVAGDIKPPQGWVQVQLSVSPDANTLATVTDPDDFAERAEEVLDRLEPHIWPTRGGTWATDADCASASLRVLEKDWARLPVTLRQGARLLCDGLGSVLRAVVSPKRYGIDSSSVPELRERIANLRARVRSESDERRDLPDLPTELPAKSLHRQSDAVASKVPSKQVRGNARVLRPLIVNALAKNPYATSRDLATQLSCSVGLIGESEPWIANQERLKMAKQRPCDPKAIPFDESFITEVGLSKRQQQSASREEVEARDAALDAHEAETTERIAEYLSNDPKADAAAVASAVNCTAGEVERFQASELMRLVAEQDRDRTEDEDRPGKRQQPVRKRP